MRLLSFLNQVEATLAVIRPEDAASGWQRRVDYQKNEAVAWNAALGLSLHLRTSQVAEGRYGLLVRWTGTSGAILEERTYFCGPSAYDWQAAAESVAELAPSGAIPGAAEPPTAKAANA
jgi:hypothetical protein